METITEFQGIDIFQDMDIQEIQDCMFRAVSFIETFMPNENDVSKLVKLTQPQKDAIDAIQFGFPLRLYDFNEIKNPPRGAVMVWPRQTGKTTACAYAAAAFLFMVPNCSIGIISASEKAAKKLFKKIIKILRHSILWNHIVKKSIRVDFLETNNGNFIECWPQTDNIRGSTYTFLFADEAAKMDEEILFAAALPTTTHGIRWIMLSTPYGPKGKFIDYYYRGLETRPIICTKCNTEFPQSAFNVDYYPNGRMPLEEMHPCPECGNFDYKYGLGVFSVPWVDPWNDGIRTVEMIKAFLDEDNWSPWARQEYLGEIISDASMVFLGEWLKQCTNAKLQNLFKSNKKFSYVCGADYGRKHDASSFAITHRNRKTGKIVLDYMLTVAGDSAGLKEHQKTYKHIRKSLLKVITKFNPYWIVPDATGLGDPLVEELEEDLTQLQRKGMIVLDDRSIIRIPAHILSTRIFNNRPNTKGFIISRVTKPDLIGNLIKMFAKGRIEIPPANEPEIGKLREELLRFECEVLPGSDYIKYGTQSFHDDRVIALALSVWGHRQRPSILHEVKMRGINYDILGGINAN